MSLISAMENSKSLSVIIAAAGNSSRLERADVKSKQFLPLDDSPLLFYSLDKISRIKDVYEIIVVTNDVISTNKLLETQSFFPNIKVVSGGTLRQDSVYNGFCQLDKKCELILIHDVARPLFDLNDLKKCIEVASKSGACILAVPAVDTIKKAKYDKDELVIESTVDRNNLYLVQTPQVFSFELLNKAYKRFRGSNNSNKETPIFTDEASMIEHIGGSVNLIIGSRNNIKITYPDDIEIAKSILHKLKVKV